MWSSVLLENTRPYPVTIAAPRPDRWGQTKVAAYESWPYVVDLTPAHLELTGTVTVPAHGTVVVARLVSGACLSTGPDGGVATTGRTTIEVTALGVTATRTVDFPDEYGVGWRGEHEPDPGC